MRLSQSALSVAAMAGVLASAAAARAQDVLPAPPPDGRAFGPVEPAGPPPVVSRGRGLSIFIPPIGGFGGFSANIGRGRVNVNVGPSGYGPYGEPAFGGVTVDVFRPRVYDAPPVVYGPAYHPIYGQGSLYLGVSDASNESAPALPSYTEALPAAAPDARSLDSVLPPPPVPVLPSAKPKGKPNGPAIPTSDPGTVETTVPQRKAETGPQIPPQTSRNPAPRFFPTQGPALLPPGVIPRNGFDVDNKVRPNPATRPGDDPFGPRRPRTDDPPA